MAKCETRPITKQVLTTVPYKEYVLTLTSDEAKFLRAYVGVSSGLMDEPSTIYDALERAGVKSGKLEVSYVVVDEDNILSNVYLVDFKENWE